MTWLKGEITEQRAQSPEPTVTAHPVKYTAEFMVTVGGDAAGTARGASMAMDEARKAGAPESAQMVASGFSRLEEPRAVYLFTWPVEVLS